MCRSGTGIEVTFLNDTGPKLNQTHTTNVPVPVGRVVPVHIFPPDNLYLICNYLTARKDTPSFQGLIKSVSCLVCVMST